MPLIEAHLLGFLFQIMPLLKFEDFLLEKVDDKYTVVYLDKDDSVKTSSTDETGRGALEHFPGKKAKAFKKNDTKGIDAYKKELSK